MKYSCPEGWITSPHGCFFFAIDIEPKTWEESVEYCEELGGYLAEVNNDEIQTLLVEEATALDPSTNWWLGATDKELVRFSIVIILLYLVFFSFLIGFFSSTCFLGGNLGLDTKW